MRILQVAPLWESVPPPAYGGIEAVVSVLTEELVRRGHDVTLCASGDSRTDAQLLSVCHRSLRTASDVHDPGPHIWLHAALSLKHAREFDIIHNHAGELVMAMSHLVPDVPMLTTVHNGITLDAGVVWQRYQGFYNTISHAQRHSIPVGVGGTYVGVVHNAIEVASFPYDEHKGEFLLFLSRLTPEKGAHLAVEVARRAGWPLVIAGKVDHEHKEYFHSVVEPRIDGRQVKYVGEADHRLKRQLYAQARCLLLPLQWEEPFGLVTVEAMASGTPVVAFGRGAIPELVIDGETGYVVSDVDQMVDAVRRIGQIRARRCRQHVEDNFDAPFLANGYLELYQRILAIHSPSEKVPTAPRPDALAVA